MEQMLMDNINMNNININLLQTNVLHKKSKILSNIEKSNDILIELNDKTNNDELNKKPKAEHILAFLRDDEPSYFLACYEPEDKEIYFSEFIREKIICKESIDATPSITITKENEEKMQKVKEHFENEWELIKTLSSFEKHGKLSKKSKQYLSRPIPSKFLFPEQLELNNFSSTSPLPAAFQQYGMININLTVHDSVCKGIPPSDRFIQKKVGFYYVVDTIVKDSLRYLISKFNNYIETSQKKEIYEPLLNKLKEDIKDRKNKYILKFKSLESYLYGDYPICTYEPIRVLVREYETVNLILMRYPIGDIQVQPDITHFPPIIYVSPNTDYNYNTLLEKYLNLYVSETRSPIIYRFKPDVTQHDLYLKKNSSRKEKLLKYVESGECDYPFYVKVKGIKNLFALKKQIDSDNYNKFKIMYPYFNEIPSLNSIKNKKNIFQKLSEKIISFCQETNKAEEHIKKEINEEKEKQNARKLMLKSYKASLEIQRELNYLKDNEIDHSLNYDKKMNLITNRISYSASLLEKLKQLTTDQKGKVNPDSSTENFILSNYKLPKTPAFVKIEVKLMYGSFEIQTLFTRFLLLNNNINIEEKLNFKNYLISHIPRETRIAINLVAYDKYHQNPFELGSCSTGVYDDNGLMEQGVIPLYIWPLFKIDPRVICCYPHKANYHLDKNLRTAYNLNANSIETYDENDYCVVFIELPKFIRPVAYNLKTPKSYTDFLKLKYPKENIDSCYEMSILFSNSIIEFRDILDSLKNRDKYFFNLEKKNEDNEYSETSLLVNSRTAKKIVGKHQKTTTFENKDLDNSRDYKEYNIWNVLEHCLPKIKETITKDPLSPLSEKEREYILYCRDYICTIPSTLEIFLRSINWLNPLQVHTARLYIKKWAKINPEDAVCLLDPRYPDTFVREYAVSILREMTDDMTSIYMLQLCQSLIYEIGLVNPLSDFLIEKALMNPKLIASSFFWNYVVNKKNRLFTERLSIYNAQILMIAGSDFLNEIKKSFYANKILKKVCTEVKMFHRDLEARKDKEAKIKALNLIKGYLKEEYAKEMKNFRFPIHPSMKCVEIDCDQIKLYFSKMVPVRISSRSSDGTTFKLMFKTGDDLRQDMLTLQILKIMDKMWLDNDLDFKITAYKVGPTGLREGLIEFVDAEGIDGLQINQGVGGALDRELLIKHLRNKGQPPNLLPKYESSKQHDNFVKSLAGFCVATCVLGIADRHLGNVMIKDNGIFFHIDYGHFLGNFKHKFGIKRERAPFLLLPEMAHVYTKTGKSEMFKSICVKAFNILRKNANRLMNLFIIMSSTGLPELSGMSDVMYLKNMLKLDKKNEEDAGNYFIGLINQSKNEKFRLLDNMIHNIKHG